MHTSCTTVATTSHYEVVDPGGNTHGSLRQLGEVRAQQHSRFLHYQVKIFKINMPASMQYCTVPVYMQKIQRRPLPPVPKSEESDSQQPQFRPFKAPPDLSEGKSQHFKSTILLPATTQTRRARGTGPPDLLGEGSVQYTSYFCQFLSAAKAANKEEESVVLVVFLMGGLFLNSPCSLKMGASRVYMPIGGEGGIPPAR